MQVTLGRLTFRPVFGALQKQERVLPPARPLAPKTGLTPAERQELKTRLVPMLHKLDVARQRQWTADSLVNQLYRDLYPRERGVIIYGGGRYGPGTPEYKFAYQLGRALTKAGYFVVNGGNHGIMHASAKGAVEGGGHATGVGFLKVPEWDKAVFPEYVLHQSPVSDRIYGKGGYEHRGAYTIVFPGDFGTEYELRTKLAELVCNSTPYPSQRKAILVDINGFYTHGFVSKMMSDIALKKARPEIQEMFTTVKGIRPILRLLADKSIPWTPGLQGECAI